MEICIQIQPVIKYCLNRNNVLHIMVFNFPFKYVFVPEFPSLFRTTPQLKGEVLNMMAG
jgi:hypothetical protein